MPTDIALCTVVTEAVLTEFEVLKFSYELFHGTDAPWFVRCDRASYAALSQHANVICTVFTQRQANRPDNESTAFRSLVAQKMSVLADAWAHSSTWTGVVFLDADLIFTAPLLPMLQTMPGELLLTPNHYPPSRRHLAAIHGEYNSGFVLTRTSRFHEWWREAFNADTTRWTDQACLNDAGDAGFEIGALGPESNVGFWRSPQVVSYNAIPAECTFLHVHLYQPLRSFREWIDKSFALHCVRFLQVSPRADRQRVLREIFRRDRCGWFESTLRVCGESWVESRS